VLPKPHPVIYSVAISVLLRTRLVPGSIVSSPLPNLYCLSKIKRLKRSGKNELTQ
jgi:hypothetical protein